MVTKGYTQQEGIDYNEAHVVKYSSIRILLALVIQYELELDQLDVKTAFLYNDLEEKIYMSQPTKFKTAGKKNMVCKLKKIIGWIKVISKTVVQAFRQFHKREEVHAKLL